ncbi:hypothetical protein [Halomarina pelagica]|nr:hypothetical protein [Halomarina sp. BND7]
MTNVGGSAAALDGRTDRPVACFADGSETSDRAVAPVARERGSY